MTYGCYLDLLHLPTFDGYECRQGKQDLQTNLKHYSQLPDADINLLVHGSIIHGKSGDIDWNVFT